MLSHVNKWRLTLWYSKHPFNKYLRNKLFSKRQYNLCNNRFSKHQYSLCNNLFNKRQYNQFNNLFNKYYKGHSQRSGVSSLPEPGRDVRLNVSYRF